MDIVYTLGHGSTWQDRELLFSLRAIHEFLPDVDRVVIVGLRPAWLRDVLHLPARDPHKCKEKNIRDKLLRACEVLDRPFLFMNDDHFALRPQRADELPNWYSGDVGTLGNRLRTGSHYREALLNTHRVLAAAGLPTRNFDVHTPIVYDPAEFPRAMAAYDWTVVRGYVVKSLYANTLGVPPTHLGDLKLSHDHTNQQIADMLKGRPWFSVGPTALTPTLQSFFAAMYPMPSRWETV